MTNFYEIPHDLIHPFPPPYEKPIDIVCDNWWQGHVPGLTKEHAPFPVSLHCQQHYSDDTQPPIHVYSGICPVCDTCYLYSPDAMPHQLAAVKRTLEDTISVTLPDDLLAYVDKQLPTEESRSEKIEEIIAEAMHRDRAAYNTLAKRLKAVEPDGMLGPLCIATNNGNQCGRFAEHAGLHIAIDPRGFPFEW